MRPHPATAGNGTSEMSKSRNKLPDIGPLLGGPNPFAGNTERLAQVLGGPRANFRPGAQGEAGGDEISDLAQFMAQNGRQLVAAVKASGDVARVARSALERTDELAANLQSVEQRVAALSNGGFAGALVHPSIGATLAQKIREGDAGSFEALAQGNTTKASMRLETNVRAALTHSGGSSSDGGMPSTPENGSVHAGPIRRLSLLQILPARKTDRDAVEHTRIGSSDDAAVQENEGDTKATVEIQPELVRAEISTLAAITSVSKQCLADHQQLAGAVDTLLRGKVLSKVENELVNGTGGAGHVEGLLSLAPTFVPSVATEAADVIGEALAVLQDGGYSPGVAVMNAIDWHELQVTRATPGGEYLHGAPTTPAAPSLWNCAIVTTAAMPRGTCVVADLNYITVLDREALKVEASEHHADNFARNLVSLRCECRVGLEVTDVWALRQLDLGTIGSSSSSS